MNARESLLPGKGGKKGRVEDNVHDLRTRGIFERRAD